jgi:hypothetical protein
LLKYLEVRKLSRFWANHEEESLLITTDDLSECKNHPELLEGFTEIDEVQFGRLDAMCYIISLVEAVDE